MDDSSPFESPGQGYACSSNGAAGGLRCGPRNLFGAASDDEEPDELKEELTWTGECARRDSQGFSSPSMSGWRASSDRIPLEELTNMEPCSPGAECIKRVNLAPEALQCHHSARMGDEPGEGHMARDASLENEVGVSPLPTGPPSLLPAKMDNENGVPIVDASTLAQCVRGDKPEGAESVHVVDCRYPYEYQGGHIIGAVNIYDPFTLASLLRSMVSQGGSTIIVLHCEFSSQRAPRMFRHIRNSDRMAHIADYPRLTFPHLYVLQGGYKAFVNEWPSLCTPPACYREMHAEGFEEHLRQSNAYQRHIWRQWPKNRRAW